MLKFNKNYFVCAALLFLIEVFIAIYIKDDFIRPYFGDFLVVILLYSFIKSFIQLSVVKTAVPVLLFSYFIETLQYFNIVSKLGLKESEIANIIIGNYFTWTDIVAYTLGIFFVLMFESIRLKTISSKVNNSENFHYFI